jgi:mono/diheme cytochrome c family protein
MMKTLPILLTCLAMGCGDSGPVAPTRDTTADADSSSASDDTSGAPDTEGPDEGDASTDEAPQGTSLVEHVMPIIDQSCGGCHTRADAPFPPAVANGVYYDDVDDVLTLVGTFILGGDSANSDFVAILTQAMAVGQGPTLMPPPDMAGAMSQDDVAIVAAWIDEGAEDN